MSSSLKALLALSGGGGGVVIDLYLVTTSMTWTAIRGGNYIVTAIGGGGSGGAVGGSTGGYFFAQGGCAGGLARKKIKLTADDTLTIVIGTGGAGNTRNNTAGHGTAGGNTTVTGTSINLVANGGSGGFAYNGFIDVPAITGGTATGGDINTTGGGQPARTSISTSAALGGSSVGIFNSVGYQGAYSSLICGAGAGVGGVGFTGGGGSFGAAPTDGTGGIGISGITSTVTSYAPNGVGFYNLFTSNGAPEGTLAPTTPGPGGGGSIGNQTDAIQGGMCAGGGGMYNDVSNNNYKAGRGGLGAGGGGAISKYNSGNFPTATSGKGGNGLVVIEYLGE